MGFLFILFFYYLFFLKDMDFDASRPNTSAQETKSIDPDFYDDGRPRPKWNADPKTWQSHGPQVRERKRGERVEKRESRVHFYVSLHALGALFTHTIRSLLTAHSYTSHTF
jgi:hypothetical protein